jgi:hypothetical protein
MADGLTSLSSLNWGTSTGGAASSGESTLTLGVDRSDTRTPPDVFHIWGAQLNAVKNLALAMSVTFKGGTRLGTLTQSSNPFGASESGFYIDAGGTAYSVFNGTPTAIGGGGASTGNWTFSGNNADLSGAATMGLGLTTANALSIGNSSFGSMTLTGARFLLSQRALTTGTQQSALAITGGAHTALTLGTEQFDVNFNLARTVQFATGGLTTQRALVVQAPTYGFVGASTLTNAATVAITGAPVAGTNATITNRYALWLQGGNLGMAANTAVANSAQAATNTTALTLTTNVADGASSVGLLVNNSTSLVNGQLLQLANAGTTLLTVKPSASDGVRMTGGSAYVVVDSTNGAILGWNSNYVQLGSTFSPGSDLLVSLGAAGQRWNGVYSGGALAAKYNTQSGTTYTVLASDHYVGLTNTAARTVTLPAANAFMAGQMLWIKDEACTAATGNVTTNRAGADTIITTATGATSLVINTNGGKIGLVSDGVSKWFQVF